MATGRVPTTANSPLTAKGDLFGYSTTQARVAVGNDGETLVADSSTSTGLRYQGNFAAGKNKIINGDMTVNQRSFTSTTSALVYTFDRFFSNYAVGTTTYSAQTFTPGAAPVAGYEARNFLRCVSAGQTGTGAYVQIVQRIEDVRTLAGQTATISFWAKSGSGTPKIGIELAQEFGSGGSPSADVTNIGSQSVTISTSWTRYSLTVSVPSLSGKTIGTTANTSCLRLNLWLSAGTDFATRAGTPGLQNETFDIWGVQVEAGSVATAFQTATGTLQGELAACQRYYYRITNNAFTKFCSGFNLSTTVASAIQPHPVVMRTAPTFASSAASSFYATLGTGGAVGTSIAGADMTPTMGEIRLTTSGLTANAANQLGAQTSPAFIEFSSEL